MYRRRGYYRKTGYNRRYYKRKAIDEKVTRSIVRREIAKDNRKDHPLMWTDYNAIFNGDYVTTTPTMFSLVERIKQHIISNPEITDQFVSRTDPTGVGNYKEGTIKLTGFHYQLRYQQNAEADNPGMDTFRHLCYSFVDTYAENTQALLDGGDIDQAPYTANVKAMYWDKIGYLKAAVTESTTDDSQFVPGQRIYKGFKKVGANFKFTWYDSSSTMRWDTGDVRFEHQSDDNSIVGEVQVYGFFRIYFRVMA